MSDDEGTENAINNFESFMSELDLSMDPPKMPELLCSVNSYNKKTNQNEFVNKIRDVNRIDGKIVDLTKALKLTFDTPLKPQL